MTVDLRFGRWQDVCADVRADVLIVDPPYLGARGGSWEDERVPLRVPYAPADLAMLAELCAIDVRGWRVIFNDFPGYMAISGIMRERGLVCPAAPIPWCKPAGAYTPTGTANSPAKSCDFIAVARPPKIKGTNHRPGHYVSEPYSPRAEIAHTGGKPLALMRAIVKDYSEPGDLVFDPCSGGGTTALACILEGRRFVGAECDPRTHEKALARLSRIPAGTRDQPSLFADMEQLPPRAE